MTKKTRAVRKKATTEQRIAAAWTRWLASGVDGVRRPRIIKKATLTPAVLTPYTTNDLGQDGER